MVVLRYRQRVGVHSRELTRSRVPTYTYVYRLKVQRSDKGSFEQTEREGEEGGIEEREARSAS